MTYASSTVTSSPALGFWGFVVCRGPQHEKIHAFNRTLFKNFCQQRGLKRTQAEMARALYGNWRLEHLFALKQAVTLYEFYRRQLRACDDQLQAHLGTFADQSGGRPSAGRE